MDIEEINEIINFSSSGDINKGELEFKFTAEKLQPGTIKTFQITDKLELGNKSFQRVGNEIYYEYIKYNVEVFHGLSLINKNENNLFAFAETKIALVWFRNPVLLNSIENLFATINSEGIVVKKSPKAPVNPNYRNAFVTIRNKYLADNICNQYYKLSTSPAISIQSPHKRVNYFYEYQPFRNKSKQDTNIEKERKRILNDSKINDSTEQYQIDNETRSKKGYQNYNKSSKLSYYSNSNNDTPLCTCYNIDQDEENIEIVTGVLCFVIITGSNLQIETDLLIEGRLCYSDQRK